jgi:hypothetical protein
MGSKTRGGQRVVIPLFGVDRTQGSGFTTKPRLNAVVRFVQDQHVHENHSGSDLEQKIISILGDGHIIVRPTRDSLGNAVSEKTTLAQVHDVPADMPFDVRNLHQQLGLPAGECESVIGVLEKNWVWMEWCALLPTREIRAMV